MLIYIVYMRLLNFTSCIFYYGSNYIKMISVLNNLDRHQKLIKNKIVINSHFKTIKSLDIINTFKSLFHPCLNINNSVIDQDDLLML